MQFAVSQICNIVRYEKFKYLLRVLTVQSCANGCIYISSTALMKCNKKRVKTELRFISMWQQMLIDISYVLNPFSLIGVRFHVDFSCKFQWYWYGMGLFCFYGMSTESINRFRAENNKCQYTMMTVSIDFVVKLFSLKEFKEVIGKEDNQKFQWNHNRISFIFMTRLQNRMANRLNYTHIVNCTKM